jgi:hypothetical protein
LYDLRSKIVHGDELKPEHFVNAREFPHLKIALYIFAECVDHLLVEEGLVSEDDR